MLFLKEETKKLKKRVWSSKENFSNRNKVLSKVTDEVSKTKEGKAYSKMMKNRRGYVVGGKTHAIYSEPTVEKTLGAILKDRQIESEYNKKYREVGLKYSEEYSSAVLKDLRYKDTQAARNAVRKAIYGK